MKKIIFMLFVLIGLNIADAQDHPDWLHPSHGVHFNDSYFINNEEGWVVGPIGYLLHTEDGGENWEEIEIDCYSTLNSINGWGENYLWAVGNDGYILRSADGGNDWDLSQLEENSIAMLRETYFSDSLNGFMVGRIPTFSQYSIIWKTEDGGDSWEEIATFTDNSLFSITFNTDTTGWVVGYKNSGRSNGVVYKSTDSGNTWTEHLVTEKTLKNLYFWNDMKGWITGDEHIFRTIDGGNSWLEEEGEFHDVDFQEIIFKDELNGWVTTFTKSYYPDFLGEIYRTFDGGANWQLLYQTSPQETNLLEALSSSESDFWACGDGLIIHSSDMGESWQSQSEVLYSGNVDNIFVFEEKIFAFANTPDQILMTSLDEGNSWSTQDSFPPLNEQSISKCDFIDETFGWITARYEMIKTEDGGLTWESLVDYDPEKYYTSIDFADSLIGWCVVFNPIDHTHSVLHTEDGGYTWTEQASLSSSVSANALRFIDENIGWICCSDGSIFKTVDGENWEQMSSIPATYGADCIEPISGVEAWAGSDYHRISHTIDGGETWETTNLDNDSGPVMDIRFKENIGFVVNKNNDVIQIPWSSIYMTSDHGENWEYFDPPVVSHLNSCFIKDDDLFVVGDYGIILRYNDIVSTGVYDEPEIINVPQTPLLMQNYPNPFNPSTTIAYQVPVGTYNYTSLRIYDTMGRLVKTLVDEKQEAGYHTVQWHGRDDNGRQVPSGIYVYRLETTDGYEETRKMILLK